MASAAKKRKLSCILLDKLLPHEIVCYCIDPYFRSHSLFDRVVVHLNFIFNEKPKDSIFFGDCRYYNRERSAETAPMFNIQYNSILHCIFTRIQLTREWNADYLSEKTKRLRHNLYNQL